MVAPVLLTSCNTSRRTESSRIWGMKELGEGAEEDAAEFNSSCREEEEF